MKLNMPDEDREKKKPKAKPAKSKPAKQKPAPKAKPARPEKRKPVPEKKAPDTKKKGLGNLFHKDPEEGFDMMTEMKEPFSFSGFFEEHVMERMRRAKAILQEKGVLFFLFSPFQAKGRMVALLMALCAGLLFGVVPRASALIGATRDRAYASEIAGLDAKNVGSIRIEPAASSNYKRMHLLAFLVSGKNLPSDPEKYEVHLSQGSGATDWNTLEYSWSMYPVDDDRRILLVAIDQTKQPSGVGMFRLFVQLAGEDLKDYQKSPYEIILSSAQETGPLYDRNGVHLSALTAAVCGSGEIAKKQEAFEDALEEYRMAVEQAEKMPVDGIKVSPSPDDLETLCLAKRLYRPLKDTSTTEDILKIEKAEKPKIEIGTVISCGGVDGGEYDEAFRAELEQSGRQLTDGQRKIFDEWDHVDEAKRKVIQAMDNVNLAAEQWYNTLSGMRLVLNQTVKVSSFPLYAKITDTIESPIAWLEGEPEGPEEESGGLVGAMTGDDPVQTQKPTQEPEGTEGPAWTPEPTTEPDAPLVTDMPTEEPEPTATPEPTPEPAASPEPSDDGQGVTIHTQGGSGTAHGATGSQPETDSSYVPNPDVTGSPSDNK